MPDSRLQQLAITARNPIEEQEYQSLLKDSGTPYSVQDGKTIVPNYGAGGNNSTVGDFNVAQNVNAIPDPIVQAQKYLDFQRTANQPVVQQLQTTSTGLEGKYKELVDSIRASGQVATDWQIRSTNTTLGQRGITSDSGLYQQEMARGLLPIQAQIGGQIAQTGMSEFNDLSNLALEIARMQAGDVPTAINAGQNYSSEVQNARQFAQNLQLQQQQQEQAQRQFDQTYKLQQQTASKADTSIQNIGGHAMLINNQTGQTIADLGVSGTPSKSGGSTKLSTSTITANGHVYLVNTQTGEKIADLGKAAATGNSSLQILQDALNNGGI